MRLRQWIAVFLCAVFLIAGLGCSSDTEQSQMTPEKLGKIGATMYQNSDRASAILEKHGLSRAEFKRKVEDISSNPETSRQYRSSFEDNLSQ